MPPLHFFRSPKAYPPFYAHYLERLAHPLDLRTPTSELRFVVVDTETTGLNPRKDRLLSIGAVAVQGGEIRLEQAFDRRILPLEPQTPQADTIAVHGILPTAVENSRPEAEVMAQFLAFLGNGVLVAHHLKFDLAIIEQALRRAQAGPLRNRRLDTVDLARRAQRPGGGTARNYNLDALAQQYGIPPHDRHTAAGDAYITAVLLLKLLSRLQTRGVRTLRDLLR